MRTTFNVGPYNVRATYMSDEHGRWLHELSVSLPATLAPIPVTLSELNIEHLCAISAAAHAPLRGAAKEN